MVLKVFPNLSDSLVPQKAISGGISSWKGLNIGRGCPGRFGFPIAEVSKELLGKVGIGHSFDSMSLEGFSNLRDPVIP